MAHDDDDDFDSKVDVDEVDENEGDGDEGTSKSRDDEPGEKARRAAKAARKERDEARAELARMRRELAAMKQGDGKDASKDDAERDREADERAHARYRPIIVKAAASAALVSAGAKPDRVARLTRLLDADEISVDEKGNVDEDDLQAEVDRVKEEWPELFRTGDDDTDTRKRPPVRGRRVDGAGKPGGTKTSSSTAKLAAALTGGSRR